MASTRNTNYRAPWEGMGLEVASAGAMAKPLPPKPGAPGTYSGRKVRDRFQKFLHCVLPGSGQPQEFLWIIILISLCSQSTFYEIKCTRSPLIPDSEPHNSFPRKQMMLPASRNSLYVNNQMSMYPPLLTQKMAHSIYYCTPSSPPPLSLSYHTFLISP